MLRARLQDLTRQEHKARRRCRVLPDKHVKQRRSVCVLHVQATANGGLPCKQVLFQCCMLERPWCASMYSTKFLGVIRATRTSHLIVLVSGDFEAAPRLQKVPRNMQASWKAARG